MTATEHRVSLAYYEDRAVINYIEATMGAYIKSPRLRRVDCATCALATDSILDLAEPTLMVSKCETEKSVHIWIQVFSCCCLPACLTTREVVNHSTEDNSFDTKENTGVKQNDKRNRIACCSLTSGLCDVRRLEASGVKVGLGTGQP